MGIEQKVADIIAKYVDGYEKDSDAARGLGVGPVTLYGWTHPRSANSKNKTLFAALDRIGAKLIAPDEHLNEYDFIPRHAAKAGAGASLETSDEVEGYYAFRKDWMGQNNLHAKNAVMLPVTGDSMEPLLFDGDMLLVDKNEKEITDGKIYVVTLGEELRVKRIFHGLDGIILRSENPRYPDINVTGPDLDTFIIHGRVRWFGRVI